MITWGISRLQFKQWLRLSILFNLSLITIPDNIDCFSASCAQTGDSSTLPGGRQCRQCIKCSIRFTLKQHFRDAGASAEIPIDLKRRVRIHQIWISSSMIMLFMIAESIRAFQLAVQQFESMISIFQSRPLADTPSYRPACSIISSALQRNFACTAFYASFSGCTLDMPWLSDE